MKRYISSVLLLLIALTSPTFAGSKSTIQERAERFLALANAGYHAVYRVNSEAQWTAVTDVTPEHDAAAEATGKAYAAFNGNPAIIKEARELLTHQKELSEITVRAVETATVKRSGRADDKSRAGGEARRCRDETGIAYERIRIQAQRPENHRQPNRR